MERDPLSIASLFKTCICFRGVKWSSFTGHFSDNRHVIVALAVSYSEGCQRVPRVPVIPLPIGSLFMTCMCFRGGVGGVICRKLLGVTPRHSFTWESTLEPCVSYTHRHLMYKESLTTLAISGTIGSTVSLLNTYSWSEALAE